VTSKLRGKDAWNQAVYVDARDWESGKQLYVIRWCFEKTALDYMK